MRIGLAALVAAGEQALAGLDPDVHVRQTKLEVGVAHQRAGQQAGLGQHLEAVADAQHGHALAGPAATSFMTGEWAAMAPQRR